MNINEMIIELARKELLTPVFYKLIDGDSITLVGFFDRGTPISAVYSVQSKLEVEFKTEVNIYDFRDFEVGDRMEILKRAELVYSENEFVKAIFEAAMFEDMRGAVEKKSQAIQREEKLGTVYYS